MTAPPHIDGGRLWQALADLAAIGATPAGGCNRLALTDADRAGRDCFVAWAREAGCEVTVDQVGNVFARRAGRDPALPPLMTGSHLDTQTTGGRYDGAYGVLAGLEVVRALNGAGLVTEHPLEVVSWTNEEGSRFYPSCTGSRAFAGDFTAEAVWALRDAAGVVLGDELTRIGYRGDAPCAPRPVHAYVEAHIEQGPVLELEGLPIGAVTGIQGKQALLVRLSGTNAHAGTTPMAVRRDPLVAAGRIVAEVDRLVRSARPDAVGTVGRFDVHPGSINVINAEVEFTVDLRCPDDAALGSLTAAVRAAIAAIAAEGSVDAAIEDVSFNAAVGFDERVIATVEAVADALSRGQRRLVSGAGHDARALAALCPTGMIFIPCAGGISHSESEAITPEHAALGAEVLLHTLLRLDARTDLVSP